MATTTSTTHSNGVSSGSALIAPYGGRLVNLVARGEERDELIRRAKELPSIRLSGRSLCELDLLATGALSPLDRFMGEADYRRVVSEMRLANGTLFPSPVVLPVDDATITVGSEIVLRGSKNEMMAILQVEEIFQAASAPEAGPEIGGGLCVSGPMKVFSLASHFDFPALRGTPASVRASLGGGNVLAFQTRGYFHRPQEVLAKSAARGLGARLLVQPVAGLAQQGDMERYTRLRTFMALAVNAETADAFSLLTLPGRVAGDREMIWQAILARNFGANHLIAAPDDSSHSQSAAVIERIAAYTSEIGVKMVPYEELAYVPDEDRYCETRAVPANKTAHTLSDDRAVDEYLAKGRPLPPWYTRGEVGDILAQAHPPMGRRGFCVWFTGLPSAGKSTISDILTVLLMERGRQATVLDGDVVRTHLSKGLGFTREDRDTNILRIGFVAAEIVRHQGVVVCAAVSPYLATREKAREMVGPDRFIEVFVDTPLAVCEQRDVKGFYAKARAGSLRGFTGVDDPYEAPIFPDIALTTGEWTPEENAQRILRYLVERGFLVAELPVEMAATANAIEKA